MWTKLRQNLRDSFYAFKNHLLQPYELNNHAGDPGPEHAKCGLES